MDRSPAVLTSVVASIASYRSSSSSGILPKDKQLNFNSRLVKGVYIYYLCRCIKLTLIHNNKKKNKIKKNRKINASEERSDTDGVMEGIEGLVCLLSTANLHYKHNCSMFIDLDRNKWCEWPLTVLFQLQQIQNEETNNKVSKSKSDAGAM